MPSPGPRTTNRYSPKFKASAVRLSKLSGMSIRSVAASLYIHPFHVVLGCLVVKVASAGRQRRG